MFATTFVIEGHDKSGKATQCELLLSALEQAGKKAVLIEVPYDDSWSCKLIYRMLYSGEAVKSPNLFQFVQFVNKFLSQIMLLPTFLKNDYVVFDRWRLSFMIYGNNSGANRFLSNVLYRLLFKPKATFVMYGSSYDRKSVDDSYEKNVKLQSLVRENYVNWALEHPEDHYLIDNKGSKQEVHSKIMKIVESYIR